VAAAATLAGRGARATLGDLGRHVTRETRRLTLCVSALLACACCCAVAAGAVVAPSVAGAAVPSWTTYHRDGVRSGVDPDSAAALPPVRAWQTNPALDGDIYGQPLVYGSRVYVATENDSVYALDAASGAVLWHQNVGTPVPDRPTAGCGNIGNVGITSTPVIDTATGRIFAVADMWDGTHASSIQHRLVGFDLADGRPAPGLPLVVDPTGSHPAQQLQRVGLALIAGRIVIGFGGNSGDCGDYHGRLVSVPEGGGSPASFEVEPSVMAGEGAIWGAGNAPAIDASGDLLVSTGNGNSGATFGLQESVIRLDPMMNVLDSWTPSNWQSLDSTDLDLGSSEPLLLPGGLVFQIGKEGVGNLLSESHLGGTGGTPVFQAPVCTSAFGGGTYYAGVIYVSCTDGLHALALNTTPATFAPASGWTVNGGAIGPPIIAGGLVWSSNWNDGMLRGLNPATGSTSFSSDLGTVDHFASPSAAGGRLFVAGGNRVTAFTIAMPPGPSPTSTVVTASANPSPPGHPLTFTATVRPVPDAGTVAFSDGGGTLSGCGAVGVSPATGQAACAATFPGPGTHTIVATFSGDQYYTGSRSDALREVIALTPPPRPRATTPSLSRLRLRISGSRLTLTLTASERVTLTLVVTQPARGRKVGRRCVRHAKSGKRCTLAIRKARRTYSDPGGRHAYALTLRTLRPGRYTLVVSARGGSGGRSRVHRLPFRIHGRRGSR
jgi:outer membrane protein assembly factor BamB